MIGFTRYKCKLEKSVNWLKEKGICVFCLLMTFKQAKAEQPGFQWEAILSYFISVAH